MSAPAPRLTDRMARLIADVNGDGVVNTADAVDLTNYLNNAGSSYPINTIVSNTTLCPIEKAYAYNEHGQQINFNTADVSAAYAYNPNGLRNIKTVGGSTKYFVYSGMNIVYEYSESVADGVAYYYGLNHTHNSKGEVYVYNAHGDVVQLVQGNAVVASYTYDAFGNLTSQIGESDNPFLYCGEYFDAETQTYYLRARYYDPANGRFTQQDAWAFMNTSDPLSLNLYAYCCNNPVMYVDPSGCWPDWAKLASGAMLLGIGVLTVGAVLATGGAATPLVALAYAGIATAGTVVTIQGAAEIGESFTGENPVKDFMGEELYETVKYGSLTVISLGSTLMQSGTLNYIDNVRPSGTSVNSFIKSNVPTDFQQNVRDAFGKDAKVSVLTHDTVVYRYHGGDAGKISFWYTPYTYENPAEKLALPTANSCDYLDMYLIPKGTSIIEGSVAPNFGQPGGGYQLYVPNPSVVKLLK